MQRIWKARNLRPWKVETFKLSNDKDLEAKFVDVVGLYLDPPERAVVFFLRWEEPVSGAGPVPSRGCRSSPVGGAR